MSEIKSALEIALERTQDVVANKEALEANTFMTEGKKAVSKFLSEENIDLKKLMEGFDKMQVDLGCSKSWTGGSTNKSAVAWVLPTERRPREDRVSYKRRREGARPTTRLSPVCGLKRGCRRPGCIEGIDRPGSVNAAGSVL